MAEYLHRFALYMLNLTAQPATSEDPVGTLGALLLTFWHAHARPGSWFMISLKQVLYDPAGGNAFAQPGPDRNRCGGCGGNNRRLMKCLTEVTVMTATRA